MTPGAARRFGIALLAGAVVGLVILGIGGRIAMRVIAVATGGSAGFSVGGTMTVVWLGALYGAPGGLVAQALRRRVAWPPLARGAVLGGVGFVIAVLAVAPRLAGPATRPPILFLALGLFAAMFLGYGMVVDAAVGRWVKPTAGTGAA